MQGEPQTREDPRAREDRVHNAIYRSWSLQMRPGELGYAAIGRRLDLLDSPPRVSVLLVVTDDDEIWIKASVASVLGQIYNSLDLCICDNASTRPHVQDVLRRLVASDDRIKACSMQKRGSRAQAWNKALGLATGEYIAVLDPGDEMPHETLLKTAELFGGTDVDLVYTDEDEIDVTGRPSNPTFKPSWSPDLLLSANVVGRLGVFRRSILEELGGFREGFESAEEYDLALRFTEKTNRVQHLPGVYYHRRRLPQRTQADNTMVLSGALREALERRGIKAAIETGLEPNSLRVIREVPRGLRASIILTAGEAPGEEYRQRLEENAGYPIHELLVASLEEVAGADGRQPFPAQRLNLAAQEARGEYLVFLSEQVTPLTRGWLTEMLGQAQRPEVGAVGGRLLVEGERDSITLGRALNLGQLAGEPQTPRAPGGDRLPLLKHPSDFPVPAGWLAVRRDVFEGAGGFDESNLPTAFYDLDLSFKLEEAGLLNVRTPYASAVYGGGPSLQPAEDEIAYMWSRWWSALIRVLYYNGSPAEQGHDRAALDTVLMASLTEASKAW